MAIMQGQKILTQLGLKYAHEVEMGDKIITHEGKFEEVTGISKRKIPAKSCLTRQNGCWVDIDGEYETLCVTSNHSFLIKREVGLEFVNSYDLKVGDYIASPRMKSEGVKGENITLDMAWFFGMYCGKGGVVKQGTPHILARFHASTPQDQVSRFCQVSGMLGAKNVNASFDQTYQMFVVKIYGESIIGLMEGLFHPAGINTPHYLPTEFHEWSLDQKTQLLLGYLGAFPERIVDRTQSWLCHSPNLSYSFCFLATSMGITIDHKADLWDYSGELDSNKDTYRDSDFIYRRITSVRNEPLAVERIAYGFEVEGSASLCLGTSIVQGVI